MKSDIICVMSYLLKNHEGDEFSFTIWYWQPLLRLAEKYGWTHPGTLPPENYSGPPKWNGNYWWNAGQIVTDEDALNLASALTKALQNLPNRKVKVTTGYHLTNKQRKNHNWAPPEQFFSGPTGKATVKEFLQFCKKGGFEIF